MGPLTKLFLGRRAMNAHFIERNGQCVIYPYWIFGRGVILNQDQKAQWERYILNFMEFYLWTIIIFFIIIATLIIKYSIDRFLVWFIIIVSTGLLCVHYEITSRKILAGAKRTSQRFTLSDHVEKMAEVLSWKRIILLTLGMVIPNCMLIAMFIDLYINLENLKLSDVIAWGISQIFLLVLYVLLAKVLIRKLHKRANSTKPDQPAGHC